MAAPDPAIQFLTDQDTGGEYDPGAGSEPYDGTAATPFWFPAPIYPSDDVQTSRKSTIGEVVQKRHGLIIARRRYSKRAFWSQNWGPINDSDLDEFETYYAARKFRLLPFGDPAGQIIVVRWLGNTFDYTALRGGWYNLKATWEAV